MSSRRSKSGSRSASRAHGARRSGAKSARRSSASARSASAARPPKGNTRRATSRGRTQPGSPGAARSRGSRAARAASHAVKLLKQDHREVKQAFAQFASAAGQEEKQQIAQRICKMLTVHAQIEEELLYPAAREALDPDDAHLVAEARVEHSSVKDLIGQIEGVDQPDEQYEAKVSVLGEYVQHHVQEEEGDLFPRLERTSVDLQALGERLQERKAALMGQQADSPQGEGAQHEEGGETGRPDARSRGGRAHRSGGLHARRR
jgi:hemerythrin superfamily protein